MILRSVVLTEVVYYSNRHLAVITKQTIPLRHWLLYRQRTRPFDTQRLFGTRNEHNFFKYNRQTQTTIVRILRVMLSTMFTPQYLWRVFRASNMIIVRNRKYDKKSSTRIVGKIFIILYRKTSTLSYVGSTLSISLSNLNLTSF